MTESQKIELRRSKVRERLGEIAKLAGDAHTDEVQAEERALQDEYGSLELRHRSAIISEDVALDNAKGEAGDLDAEQRERIELRSKASLGAYMKAALTGRHGARSGKLNCRQPPVSMGSRSNFGTCRSSAPPSTGPSRQHRAPSGSISIRSGRAVFAPSIADKLMIDMPRVASGTYATGTVSSTAGSVLTADAVAKSAEVPQTAGAITVGTASPKRVGASLGLTLEDIARDRHRQFRIGVASEREFGAER